MSKSKAAERVKVGLPIGVRVKNVLRLAYRARRSPLLEGPTGIGKSEVIRQVASELGIEFRVLDLSLLEPPDLVGLPVIAEGRTTYACPQLLPQAGAGILLLEELNRAERYVQQPALQLLTARQLHEYVLPEGWVPFAAINPEDGAYQVHPMDPALRARFLNLVVRADRDTWLAWAQDAKIHPAVLRLARKDARFLDDTPPRTWTYVSDFLKAATPAELSDLPLLHDALGGYLASSWVEVLLRELERCPVYEGVDAELVLRTYHKDSSLQRRVRQLAQEGKTDALDQLGFWAAQRVSEPELSTSAHNGAFVLEAFEGLLADLPGDHRELLQDALVSNPAAGVLLTVKPNDVLHGSYPNSNICTQVAGWIHNPYQRHRARLLLRTVCQAVHSDKDIYTLRTTNGKRIGLTKFYTQLPPAWRNELDRVLQQRNIELMPLK